MMMAGRDLNPFALPTLVQSGYPSGPTQLHCFCMDGDVVVDGRFLAGRVYGGPQHTLPRGPEFLLVGLPWNVEIKAVLGSSTRPGARAGIPAAIWAAMEDSYYTTAVYLLAFGTLGGCAVRERVSTSRMYNQDGGVLFDFLINSLQVVATGSALRSETATQRNILEVELNLDFREAGSDREQSVQGSRLTRVLRCRAPCPPANPLRLQGRKIMQGDMHHGKEGLGSHGLHFGAMTTSLSVLRASLNYEEQGKTAKRDLYTALVRHLPLPVLFLAPPAVNTAVVGRGQLAYMAQSSDTHKTPYDPVKRCRERKINIKASERVNVDVFTQNKRPCPQHSQTPFSFAMGRGGVVGRLLASHQGDQGSIPDEVAPGPPHVAIMPDDAASRRVFSGISRLPCLIDLETGILVMMCSGERDCRRMGSTSGVERLRRRDLWHLVPEAIAGNSR
ncbi:hypothetical protein PR048_016648 [Dryococelus australis]|uniref:Uncharacterized protein n=1 Tax=Dryococelus australis TaxID=614101 RepID=A0ABQ9H7D8_9NEOP|nr:hypothetical protein PR048_016648 [Dryococelus australis]